MQCDFRLALVPAADHEEGSHRAVYTMRGEYPHFIGYNRGPDYYPENTDRTAFDWKESVAIGHIPEVAHTYQYYDAIYGVMNEHQVSIGESTCSGYFFAKPVHAGGRALFDVTELSRLAMERTTTAREAVLLIGAMAEKYGYYQCDWNSDNHTQQMVGGEALTIADATEVFMFHILPVRCYIIATPYRLPLP
jgi:dipeptidase